MFLMWGMHKLAWRRLEMLDALNSSSGLWWFASKVIFFVVLLNAQFYIYLSISIAVAWMEFLSLDTIESLAMRRWHFEISFNTFVLVFSLLVLVEAVFSWRSTRSAVSGSISPVPCPTPYASLD
jgi:hypothetical protein